MIGCKVKEISRVDLIQEYAQYFHEKICVELTSFWDK